MPKLIKSALWATSVLVKINNAHWTDEVKNRVLLVPNVVYICTPESLNHVFQPLDLGAIAALKNAIQTTKDTMFERETEKALRDKTSLIPPPILGNLVSQWIKEVFESSEFDAYCATTGFDRSGLLWYLFNDVPHKAIDCDVYEGSNSTVIEVSDTESDEEVILSVPI